MAAVQIGYNSFLIVNILIKKICCKQFQSISYYVKNNDIIVTFFLGGGGGGLCIQVKFSFKEMLVQCDFMIVLEKKYHLMTSIKKFNIPHKKPLITITTQLLNVNTT